MQNTIEQEQAARTERARDALANELFCIVRKAPGLWLVQNGDKLPYDVRKNGAGWSCTCPDYGRYQGRLRCKHIEAIRLSDGEQEKSSIVGKEDKLDNNGKSVDLSGGWVKLYHPAGGGVQVTLPVPSYPLSSEQAESMFMNVALLVGAGFMVNPAGLEEGEKRELVTHLVRRRKKEDDGSYTPIFDVYTGGNFRVLSVYLDVDKVDETAEFVSLFGAMDRFKVYPSAAPLERGKDAENDREYAIPVADRGGYVVYKGNPKYDEAEAEKAAAEKKAYKVAKRVFVRFERGGSTAAPAAPANGNGQAAPAANAPVGRKYTDGKLVGPGAESDAYDRHVKAVGHAPASKDALREWLKANPPA